MPRTQSALLEAMAERQITVDGESRPLPSPFLILATENPLDHEGVFPLPEAQLDRFFLKVALGYPQPDEELESSRRNGTGIRSTGSRPSSGSTTCGRSSTPSRTSTSTRCCSAG